MGRVQGERNRRRHRLRRAADDRRHTAAHERRVAADHPALPSRAARGGGGRDLPSLHAVVELRTRPGDHRERRPDDRDDVSFELAAIGRAGAEHRYEVTQAALAAYAAATGDRSGGPVFAILPVWETIAPASLSVASAEARTRAVH